MGFNLNYRSIFVIETNLIIIIIIIIIIITIIFEVFDEIELHLQVKQKIMKG